MPLQLAFEESGDGPAVVILHGLFGSSRNWRSVARALAATHRVLCVDLRNHGLSPWDASMSYPEMADDVRELIHAQGLEDPTVIGHSMGGKAALVLALETPDLLERLIVVDIAPVSYADRFSKYVEAMRSVDTHSLKKRIDAMRALSERIQDADVVGFLMQNLVPRDGHFDWRVNLTAIGASIPTLSGFPNIALAKCRTATTLIRGSMSDYVQETDVSAFRAAFPNLDVVDVDGAGHWVHADRPVQFQAALGLTPALAGIGARMPRAGR